MVIDEDVFLEHFGKKGMRWGQRKTKKSMTPQDYKRKKKRLDRVHKTVKIAAGAAFAASLLAGASNGSGKSKQAVGTQSVEPLLRVIKPNLAKNAGKLKPSVVNSAQALRNEELRRNGAFHIRKMLKDMGENVV